MRNVMLAVLLAALCAPVAGAYEMKAKINTYACEDRAFMEKFKEAAVADDKQAIMIAVSAMLIASQPGGDCISIKKGEAVDVLKSELFAGILTIRKTGRFGVIAHLGAVLA